MGKRVLVMAGGTGGHVFPALAIVRELQQRGHVVEWLGTRGRLEEKLIPNEGINIHFIDVQGVRRHGALSLIKAPFTLMHAVLQAKAVMKQFKPDVVVGFGGYASAPGGLAAYLSGIPLIIHEQNAAAGLTNRLLSKFASSILLGVGHAFSGDKVEAVGNPVRADILALHEQERSFEHEDGKTHVLLIGGSLGAQALNEKVSTALVQGFGDDIVMMHQCGKGNSESTQERYKEAKFKVQVSDFVTDMASAYAQADLIICRAGASTVSEVSVAKLPAIFIPLPTAVDDHQTKNAMTLVEVNAAKIIKQSELTAEKLIATINEMRSLESLKAMSQASAQAAKLEATTRVADIVESLAK